MKLFNKKQKQFEQILIRTRQPIKQESYISLLDFLLIIIAFSMAVSFNCYVQAK